MKIKQTKHSNKHRLHIVAFIFLSTAVVVNAAFTFYLIQRDRNSGDFKLGYMIVSAVENLNTPLAIEPVSGKTYISSAKLMFPPADNNLGQVLYRYEPGTSNDLPTELQIASRNNISRYSSQLITTSSNNGDPKAIFEILPKLQACARGVTITFQPREGDKAAPTKLLSNGKTAYFYAEPNCPNPDLLSYAKQIDSY